MICARRFILLLVGLLATSVSVFAEERIEMIVDRSERAVEIYFSLPAVTAVERFALAEEDLVNELGYANFELFSQGTWELGEKFRQGIELRVGDHAVPLEAMSLMLHPEKLSLPYETPLDAMISIEVCGVAEQGITLEDARVYVGLIAYPKKPHDSVSLFLPEAAASLTGNLRDFSNHRLRSHSEISNPLAGIHLKAEDQGFLLKQSSIGVLGVFLATLLGLSCAGVVYVWRDKR